MNVILASQSPRRQELMEKFHIPFCVQVADIDETFSPEKDPYDEVARVSRLKAEAVPHSREDVVIAADTIVVCDGKILGKPKDTADAKQMLTLLSGREHQVMTGMTVLYNGKTTSCTEVTTLHFRPLSETEILRYIRSGEPMDKAGSYGIQGGGALFAEKIEGDYFNVVGLPVCRLGQILRTVVPELWEEIQ